MLTFVPGEANAEEQLESPNPKFDRLLSLTCRLVVDSQYGAYAVSFNRD